MRADALPPLSPADDRLRAGRQREHRRVRSAGRRSRERTRAAGAWVHVDGAFGLWARGRAGARAPRRRASELADSWATDAHKWLNVPVRQRPRVRARRRRAARRDGGDGRLPAAPSGRAQPVRLHARALAPRARRRGLGGAALARPRGARRARSSATAGSATRFAEGLAAAGYEILNDVVLNQVLVSFGEPAATQRVIAAVQADGTCWCGGTVWQGRTAMRISVSLVGDDRRRRRAQPRRRCCASRARRAGLKQPPAERRRAEARQHEHVASPGQADDLQAERQAVAIDAGRQRERRPAERVERLRQRIHAASSCRVRRSARARRAPRRRAGCRSPPPRPRSAAAPPRARCGPRT